jgi:hypothetical protein
LVVHTFNVIAGACVREGILARGIVGPTDQVISMRMFIPVLRFSHDRGLLRE